MKRKSTLAIIAAVLLMAAFLSACTKEETPQSTPTAEAELISETPTPKPESISVGYLYMGNDYYVQNLKDDLSVLENIDMFRHTVHNAETTVETAEDDIDKLVQEGCIIIYTINVDEEIILSKAEQYPDTIFEIFKGTDNDDLLNVSLIRSREYQYQYINGMVAGYLSTTGNIGYIAESADNDTIRQVNAFALGARSVNKEAEVHFAWTGIDNNIYTDEDVLDIMSDSKCDVIMRKRYSENMLDYASKNDITVISTKISDDDDVIDMLKPSLSSTMAQNVHNAYKGEFESKDFADGWIRISEADMIYEWELLSNAQNENINKRIKQMANEEWDVFTGPIEDIYGNTIIPDGISISDEDLRYMLWYVSNIQAMQPPSG